MKFLINTKCIMYLQAPKALLLAPIGFCVPFWLTPNPKGGVPTPLTAFECFQKGELQMHTARVYAKGLGKLQRKNWNFPAPLIQYPTRKVGTSLSDAWWQVTPWSHHFLKCKLRPHSMIPETVFGSTVLTKG